MIDDVSAYELQSEPLLNCDLEVFADYMWELTGDGRRRTMPAGRSVPLSASADKRAPRKEPRLNLILYTSAQSERSQRAVRTVREVLGDYDPSQVRLTTCDLSATPEDGEGDSVVFTPMLVKQGPGPRTAIIGNLEDREILRDLLETSGVDRRRWDD